MLHFFLTLHAPVLLPFKHVAFMLRVTTSYDFSSLLKVYTFFNHKPKVLPKTD